MVEEVEGVEGHFFGGVAKEGFGGESHAAVVEDEGLIFAAVGWGVGEVKGLTLPGGFEGAEAHDPLIMEGKGRISGFGIRSEQSMGVHHSEGSGKTGRKYVV